MFTLKTAPQKKKKAQKRNVMHNVATLKCITEIGISLY